VACKWRRRRTRS